MSEVIVRYSDNGYGNVSGEIVGDIVRCKECKWRDDGNGANRALICTNEYIDIDCHPDFYCGYGERREP